MAPRIRDLRPSPPRPNSGIVLSREQGGAVNVTDFFSYLLRHETSRGLAIALADAYLCRLRIQKARAGAGEVVAARAS